MGTTRDDGSQQTMWVATADLPQGGGHPFYERLNQILSAAGWPRVQQEQERGYGSRSVVAENRSSDTRAPGAEQRRLKKSLQFERRPHTTVAGRDLHPLRNGALSRRTE